ncbi:MAG: hypothetical protein MUE96_02755 [Bacteroidia bacterium]|jgi:hypothetical protein|nr:hypothetical protein [Bacteroidia bacterium]
MNNTAFEEQLKQWFSQWKMSLEKMNVRYNLGKMDAAEAFEAQKNQLKSMIETLKQNVDKATDMAEEHAQKLRSSIEELNLQVHLGKADTVEAISAQRKKIDLAMQEVYAAAKLAYTGNYAYMMELFDHNAKAIKTGLEIAQLQFTLAKMEVKEEAEKARKELDEKIAELQSSATKVSELTRENLERMGKQFQEQMQKMSSWMEQWIQPK